MIYSLLASHGIEKEISMQSATTSQIPSEIEILGRILGNQNGTLPPRMANYLIDLHFSATDKERMHDLAVRNQDGTLADYEKEEVAAYAKAGTLLSILKSKARRDLLLNANNS
jgi:hypothetical protein